MRVSDLLEELIRLTEEDESVLDLRVTLAGLEYNSTGVHVTTNWEDTETVLDIT